MSLKQQGVGIEHIGTNIGNMNFFALRISNCTPYQFTESFPSLTFHQLNYSAHNLLLRLGLPTYENYYRFALVRITYWTL